MNKKILVIDDEESVIWVVRKALEPIGYEVEARKNIRSGIKALDGFRLILLDLILPDGNGIDALKEIRVFNPDALVIIVTAHGKMESVIDAMKEGAYDYLEKPFDIEELKIVVEKAFKDLSIRDELLTLRQTKEESKTSQIIGKSHGMLKIFKEIGRVAPKDVTVLISGGSGTGKELVAKAIHNNSRRKFGPFIAINAASIPKELLEAELFGWEKGAFTGAQEKKEGKIQAASSGTLFLDEISELDINMQAKLLRFLQEQEYSPLGSNKIIKADVRIIGATNTNLKECVKKGQFREDLYYRFNVIEIKLPLLKERKEDIIPLARHFLKVSVKVFELPPKDFSKDAEKALIEYDWPGNVRELRNLMERAAIMVQEGRILPADLAIISKTGVGYQDTSQFMDERFGSLREARASFERIYITGRLKENNWNITKTAEDLKIERTNLHRKMKMLGIEERR